MAFSLPGYSDPKNGDPVTYFVLTKIDVDLLNQQLTVFVNGYVNQAAFAAEESPANDDFTNMSFVISGSLYDTFLAAVTAYDIPVGTPQGALLTELIGALQSNMLTLPFFTGASIST